MLAKEKRERTGFKHEKTHSLEHEENGRFLKSISFAFPVYYNDKEFTTIAFGEDALKEYRSVENETLLTFFD